MTRQTRKAIETLKREFRDYCWGLYFGSIRHAAIEGTDNHSELRLCPLATAAIHRGDRVDALLQDPEHRKLAEAVNREREHVRKHLDEEDPDAPPESLDRDATLYAAAAILHEGPHRAEIARILDMDPAIVEHLATATDNPDSETGRALVRALSSPNNTLRMEYEAHYGSKPRVNSSGRDR
ncbi:MAG: hypothetical protein F4018_12270 [Acidobacteria bacterium]|nr:hypothetical protein [Acidobacteriota bacterium]MYH29932.1 hypothetical protein [Acidobacteriota bacterium]MYK89039.1 hypothetical protein [Acidobacteriota bacterium]